MEQIQISHNDIQFTISSNKNVGLIFKGNLIGYIHHKYVFDQQVMDIILEGSIPVSFSIPFIQISTFFPLIQIPVRVSRVRLIYEQQGV